MGDGWYANLRQRALLVAGGVANPSELHRQAQADELAAQRLELELQNEDLRATQQALQRARDRYRDLFYRAPAPQLVVDARTIILDANMRAGALLGLHPFRLRTRPLSSFMSEADADAVYLHLRHCSCDVNGRHRCAVSLRQHDGTMVAVELRTNVVVDGTQFQTMIIVGPDATVCPTSGEWSFHRPAVLVVDDDSAILRGVVRMLRSVGLHAVSAASAAEAMSILDRESDTFDLLLTDVDMGDIDGQQLAAWTRCAHPNTSIVFMTGGMHKTADLGAPVLAKPFSPEELETLVRAQLDSR